jgi:phospholipase C
MINSARDSRPLYYLRSQSTESRFIAVLTGLPSPLFLILLLIGYSIILPAYGQLQQATGVTISNKTTTNPIKHIMQENRSFDKYFGTYPSANGIPKSTCMPLSPDHANMGCVKPFLSTNDRSEDLPHGSQSSAVAYDNGRMDGFMLAENEDPKTMSYYDNKTIPYYWNLATHSVLADNFYSSVLSYSLPNHWYAIAGQAPATSMVYRMQRAAHNNILNQNVNFSTIGGDDGSLTNASTSPTNYGVNPNPRGQRANVARVYLEESNLTKTVADLFINNTNNNNNDNITWKYYDHPVQIGGYKASVNSGRAFEYWNPFSAKGTTYTSQYSRHFVNRAQIFADR